MSGKALSLGLTLLGTSQPSSRLTNELNELNSLASSPNVTYREKKHVQAINKWAKGDLYGAALEWEDVLLEHPTDIHALKMAFDTYFFLGRQIEMRDSLARVMPFWTSRAIPLKSYLHGMYSFGLLETNFHEKAEVEAKKGLDRNCKDGWATHSLGHVFEMQSRANEGIAFYESTEDNWKICNHLACHNYWHWALYHIENGDTDLAADIMTKEVIPRSLSSTTLLDIHDCVSLPMRLELDDVRAKEITKKIWPQIFNIVEPHLEDHILAFNDAHFMAACVFSGRMDAAEQLLESVQTNLETCHISGKGQVVPLLKAILAFGREDYKSAVDYLLPIRYQIRKIGGSDAQRDLFAQLLIVSALRSPSAHHQKLVEHLLVERQAKAESKLTTRLLFRLRDSRI